MKEMSKNRKTIVLCVVVLILIAACLGFFVLGGSGGKKEGSTRKSDVPAVEKGTEDSALITLQGDKARIDGSGAVFDDNKVIISAAGTYSVTGNAADGRVVVEAGENDEVTLKLKGVDITCKEKSAVRVKSASQCTVFLEEGTENRIVSGTKKELSGAAPSADAKGGAIRSACDLTIDGAGKLFVGGYIKNGIHSAAALTVKRGTISVEAIEHGMKGKEGVTIADGTFSIKSAQDALQSGGAVLIEKAELEMAAGDDGIHADKQLQIKGGSVQITESKEGLESNQIEISGGKVSLQSTDDGINAYGGEQNGMGFGGFGREEESGSEEDSPKETPNLTISGGKVSVNSGGDALDSNGNITVEGGEVIVDGPENDGNGAIDYASENGGSCVVNGGTVLAVGSSGMAETFGESSKQCSFRCNLEKPYAAGTQISILDSEGQEIYAYKSAKTFSSVVFSSEKLKEGECYTLKTGSDETSVEQTAVSASVGEMGRVGGMRHGGFKQRPGSGEKNKGEKPGYERQ